MGRGLRVAVTGATGFVARHVRRHLSENGAELRSVSRRGFRRLRNEEAIVAERYDPGNILPGIRGCDAMVHLVGLGSQSAGEGFDAVNFRLTGRIVDLCRRARIGKIVYLSGLGASRDSPLAYFLSKYRAEREIAGSGLDFTILRPSYIVGGGDPLTRRLRRQARRGLVTVPGSGRFLIQPIHVGDAARVISESLAGGRLSNRVLDLVGPEVTTYGSYARRFARNAGATVRRVPLERAYREAVTRRGGDFDVDDLNLLVGNFCGDFGRLERASGVRFQRVSGLLQSGVLL